MICVCLKSKNDKNTKKCVKVALAFLASAPTPFLSQLEVVVRELDRHVLDAVQQLIHEVRAEVLVVGEDVRAVAVLAGKVGRATDDLAADLCFHVHRGDVPVQVVLGHVLVAAVLALIFLDIGVGVHVVIQLGLREVPGEGMCQWEYSGTSRNLHFVALLALQGRCLVVVQMVQLQRLFGEEQLATRVTRDVRVAGVDDLMRF